MVRNYLLIAEDRDEQERLYDTYWKPIEMMFGDDPESEKLNAGIRMWLTIRFVKVSIHDKGETYSVFKTYVESEYDGTLEDLLIELRDFCLMWSENYRDHDIMTGSKEFRALGLGRGQAHDAHPASFQPGRLLGPRCLFGAQESGAARMRSGGAAFQCCRTAAARGPAR